MSEVVGSEPTRKKRVEREIECLWILKVDQGVTARQALSWVSSQEGWACEGIKVSTLYTRIKELIAAGCLNEKGGYVTLTEAGKARLDSYLSKARNAEKFRLAAARRESVKAES